MSYCCLVPIYRYPVQYTVASGESFTEIDRFVLRAVRETHGVTLGRLEERLCLPPRLLAETVVGLAKRGYLGLSGGEHPALRVTTLGGRVLKGNRLTPAIRLRHESTDVFVEAFTGQALLRNDLTYTNRWRLEVRGVSANAIHLSKELNNVRPPDPGKVHPMLSTRLKSSEWIHSLTVAPAAMSEEHFLPLDVYPESGAVVTLPQPWQHLRERVIREIRERIASGQELVECSYFRRAPRHSEAAEPVGFTPIIGRWHEAQIDSTNLLIGNRSHENYLRTVLTERSENEYYILIASAFLDTNNLESRLHGWILEAVRRGTRVELLWGYQAYSGKTTKEREAFTWLRNLQEEARAAGGPGDIVFNERRTGSHAKLLLHGRGENFELCLGSYNWLSARPSEPDSSDDSSNVSVWTGAPGLVAELCLSAANLWESASERGISSDIQHWRSFAQSLVVRAVRERELSQVNEPLIDSDLILESSEQLSVTKHDRARIQSIHNFDHEFYLREFLRTYKHRCAVVSHTFNIAGTIRLNRFAGAREQHRRPPVIRYGESLLTPSEYSQLETLMGGAGINLDREEHLHAKVAIADDRCMISSYNFLAAQTGSSSYELREMGLLIEGGGVADILWERLCPQSELTPTDSNSTRPESAEYGVMIPREATPVSQTETSVIFRLEGYPEAGRVALAGTFNGWDPSQHLCEHEGGAWVISLELPPGGHLYKFIVDGSWIIDPANPDTKTDANGNLNSVIRV